MACWCVVGFNLRLLQQDIRSIEADGPSGATLGGDTVTRWSDHNATEFHHSSTVREDKCPGACPTYTAAGRSLLDVQSCSTSSREVVSYSPGPSGVKFRSHPNHLTVGKPRFKNFQVYPCHLYLSIFIGAPHRLPWGHYRNLLETCPAKDLLPAPERSSLGSGGAQLAPTPGHIAVNAWQRLLASPSTYPIDPLLPTFAPNSGALRDLRPRHPRGAPPLPGSSPRSGQRRGFARQIPAIWFVPPVTLFRRLEGRGNAKKPQERLESNENREARLESKSPSGPGAGRAAGRRRRRCCRRDALCLAGLPGAPEGHRSKDTRPPAPRAPRPRRRQCRSQAGERSCGERGRRVAGGRARGRRPLLGEPCVPRAAEEPPGAAAKSPLRFCLALQ
nr:PREDICTED: uncharacterized protein LOC103565806 [Equus przewalskii]